MSLNNQPFIEFYMELEKRRTLLRTLRAMRQYEKDWHSQVHFCLSHNLTGFENWLSEMRDTEGKPLFGKELLE